MKTTELHHVTFTKKELDHLLYILEKEVKNDRGDVKRTKNLVEEIKLQTVWAKAGV